MRGGGPWYAQRAVSGYASNPMPITRTSVEASEGFLRPHRQHLSRHQSDRQVEWRELTRWDESGHLTIALTDPREECSAGKRRENTAKGWLSVRGVKYTTVIIIVTITITAEEARGEDGRAEGVPVAAGGEGRVARGEGEQGELEVREEQGTPMTTLSTQ